MNFREFLGAGSYQTSSWRLTKEEIVRYWQTLRPDVPVMFDPIRPGQTGSTFGEDGIRLTGSRRFIDSVLGRLKDIMQYENPRTKLSLVYRQAQYKGSRVPDKSTSFVFYAQAKQRGESSPGRPPKLRP